MLNIDFFLVLNALLGLCIGSFLNVIIYRLPIGLKRYWKISCQAYLKAHTIPRLSYKCLACPRSQCPYCQHTIRFRHNIPIIGYLWLRGRCHDCQKPIARQYLIFEALTAVMFFLVAWHFGLSWQWFWALWLTSILIVLSGIDMKHQILPDEITLLLLWLGLGLSVWGLFTRSPDAIIGGLLGYLILWGVANMYQLITGKFAMGHGDFKLLAALGAWLGWQSLPLIVLISALTGSLVGLGFIIFKKQSLQTPIPFGPFIALAGWIALMGGETITEAYYQMMGLPCFVLD